LSIKVKMNYFVIVIGIMLVIILVYFIVDNLLISEDMTEDIPETFLTPPSSMFTSTLPPSISQSLSPSLSESINQSLSRAVPPMTSPYSAPLALPVNQDTATHSENKDKNRKHRRHKKKKGESHQLGVPTNNDFGGTPINLQLNNNTDSGVTRESSYPRRRRKYYIIDDDYEDEYEDEYESDYESDYEDDFQPYMFFNDMPMTSASAYSTHAPLYTPPPMPAPAPAPMATSTFAPNTPPPVTQPPVTPPVAANNPPPTAPPTATPTAPPPATPPPPSSDLPKINSAPLDIAPVSVEGLLTGKITFDPSKWIYTAEKGQLLLNGKPLMLKGVNWAGFENAEMLHAGHWLSKFTVEYGMQFLNKNGFNAIRVPVSAEFMQYFDNPKARVGSKNVLATKVDLGETALDGQTPETAFRHFLNMAWKYGLLILIDLHTFVGAWWDPVAKQLRGGNTDKENSGMTLVSINNPSYLNKTTNLDISALDPKDVVSSFTEEVVAALWGKMAKYCAQYPHVFGFDMKNEPNNKAGPIKWPEYIATCAKYGDACLANNPMAVIFVEGLDEPTKRSEKYHVVNWGGALSDVATGGVVLSVPNKIVYSPHIYPFGGKAGEEDWMANWGYLIGKECIIPGEWGGMTAESEQKAFMTDMAAFIAKKQISQFFWCFQGNSGDTGGLLDAANKWAGDTKTWDEVDTVKLAIIESAHTAGGTNMLEIFKASGAAYA
jgi:aryl-phospho-beta-D-glucosidase BglC (GH1 family)